jgi:hypothetical protein
MDLCNYDGFPLLFVELDHHYGDGSLALCHHGGMKSDAYPCHHCGAFRCHREIVPFSWMRHLDWFLVVVLVSAASVTAPSCLPSLSRMTIPP